MRPTHSTALVVTCLLLLALFLATRREEPKSSLLTLEAPRLAGQSEPTMPEVPASFVPDVAQCLEAVTAGTPLQLTWEGAAPVQLLLRPRRLLGDNFAVRLGARGATLAAKPLAFSGHAVVGGRLGQANLVFVKDAIAGQILWPDGSTFLFQQDKAGGNLFGHWEESPQARCQIDPRTRVATMQQENLNGSAPTRFPLALTAALGGGIDPATQRLDKYVDPIPRGEAYELTLKPLLLLMVLDKSATGSGDAENLTANASRYLAMVSNAASCYENQLGIRLLIQELIMIPSEDGYDDIPVTPNSNDQGLSNYSSWLSVERNQSIYQWDVAAKWGRGLAAGLLGLANTSQVRSSIGVCVIRPGNSWHTLGHEIAHVLGSDHTQGGIMNAVANPSRDFFRVAEGGDLTGAAQIHAITNDRIREAPTLRHPEEAPRAMDDLRFTPKNEPIQFDPSVNDESQPPFGKKNAVISLEEVSEVTPTWAGQAKVVGQEILFVPSANYEGTAWFSYTLRGSIGNSGQGWLHKADVAILVGESQASPFDLTLIPGQSHSFYPVGGSANLQQPSQARADVSQDESQQLLLRVRADAKGSDSFLVGGNTYRITYASLPLEVRPDSYMHNAGLGELRLFPLANDWGAGYRWLHAGLIKVGSQNAKGEIQPFPASLRLVEARNLTPDFGTLRVLMALVTQVGKPVEVPTGELRFSPVINVEGTARISYTVEDATGQRKTGLITIQLAGASETLVHSDQECQFLLPSASDEGLGWAALDYNDILWSRGKTGIGFDIGVEDDYRPFIRTDVQQTMLDQSRSIFLRVPFEVTDSARYGALLLKMRYDDGFVAYLNGTEVARRNAPSAVSWSSSAVESHEADQAETIDISNGLDALRSGRNILAIQGMNRQINSSDFLIQPELTAINQVLLARIVSPVGKSTTVGRGSGVIFRASPPSPTGTKQRRSWQIIQAPPGVRVEQFPSEEEGIFFFEDAGSYRLRLIAEQDGLRSLDHYEIRVDGSLTTFPSIEAGDNQTITSLEASMQGRVTGRSGAESKIRWELVSGPGTVVFDKEESLFAKARLSTPGIYRLRLRWSDPQITLCDDVIVQAQVSDRTLVGPDTEGRVAVPGNGEFGSRWRLANFEDGNWLTTRHALGYDIDPDGNLADRIITNVRDIMYRHSATLYVRFPFTIAENEAVQTLSLSVMVDDGYVAYLNGREVARLNAPASGLGWNSVATQPAPPPESILTNLGNMRHLLVTGKNVLAIHGLNYTSLNDDFLLRVSLTAQVSKGQAVASPYQRWSQGFGALTVAQREKGSDPDGDGFANAVEFVLGLDPTKSDSASVPLLVRPEGAGFALEFSRRSGVGQVAVEQSPDLSQESWKPIEAKILAVTPLSQGMERIAVELPRTKERGFYRLHASLAD